MNCQDESQIVTAESFEERMALPRHADRSQWYVLHSAGGATDWRTHCSEI